ncbi:hypothetical protein BDV95DRAFT_595257 [Massariosphaeria phaeospora]|uniref:Uncharacterized protein n=1 Tax=Massariosphaeria phaeospora TaxID=100035 RepID=A0A7C8I9A9_9PLEO|nr:hypothetical protein BDV95DRAFT_595257 [Massariosphaeria phaeospora]
MYDVQVGRESSDPSHDEFDFDIHSNRHRTDRASGAREFASWLCPSQPKLEIDRSSRMRRVPQSKTPTPQSVVKDAEPRNYPSFPGIRICYRTKGATHTCPDSKHQHHGRRSRMPISWYQDAVSRGGCACLRSLFYPNPSQWYLSSPSPSAPSASSAAPFGLPPNHPTVIESGWDPAMVNTSLHADWQNIIDAGYNVRVFLLGPEEMNKPDTIARLGTELLKQDWAVAEVGFGVRGSNRTDLTIELEQLVALFEDKTSDDTVIAFSHSPSSGLETMLRHAALADDCPPGKDLGFETICGSTVCK